MKFLTFSFAVAALMSSIASAQQIQTQENSLRLGVSFNSSALVLADSTDTLTTSQTSMVWGTTFQSYQGFLGELAFARSNIYEMQYNTEIVEVDESYSNRMFGVGYRMPMNSTDRFWGVGYQRVSAEGDSTNVLRTFWERDNSQRYGIINLSYSSDDESTMLGVSGQHIWFLNHIAGIGLNWGVGSGSIDNSDIGIGSANFGASVMFRPRF